MARAAGKGCGQLMGFRRPWQQRKYHLASHFRKHGDGSISALCFKKPRRINLQQAYWTIRPAAVTCEACLKLMSLFEKEKS